MRCFSAACSKIKAVCVIVWKSNTKLYQKALSCLGGVQVEKKWGAVALSCT